MEARQKSVHLVFDSLNETPVDNSSDVLHLVGLSDIDVLPTWDQLLGHLLSKYVVVHLKSQTEILWIVVSDPTERVEELNVNGLHVRQLDLLAQHHGVERADEEGVDELLMEGGHAGDPPDEPEPDQMVLAADARVGVDLQSVVVSGGVLEQTVVRVEQVSCEK